MHTHTSTLPCSQAGHDILDHVAVSVACPLCGGRYDVTLRHVLLSHDMMHTGCPVHDERECPPLTYSPLASPSTIENLERAWMTLASEVRRAGLELTLLRAAA